MFSNIKMKSKIGIKLLRKQEKLKIYKITENAIIKIFEKDLINFAKYNKTFYELFFNNGLLLSSIFLKNLYESFMSFYFYKMQGIKTNKLNLDKYLTDRGTKQLKIKSRKSLVKLKKIKIKVKKKVKKERKIKTYFYIKKQAMKPFQVQKDKLSRFFKSQMDGRFIPNQKSFNFKNNVIHNLINYDNYGIIVNKKKKIILTKNKFKISTKLICNQFFKKLLVSIHKNYKNFNFSVLTHKFYTRIFDFCMFKDLKVFNTNQFIIKNEVMDSEDNDDAEDDVESLNFYSGLTVKFSIKRRNCFFQIWEDISGFTLAKVTAGLFGYYFKKGIKKFRQFNAFVKFFRSYFNSIVVTYRGKAFKRFLNMRRLATKEFNIKNLKILKKRKFIRNNNNKIIKIINYYKNFLDTNFTHIKLQKIKSDIKKHKVKKFYNIDSKIFLLIELKLNKLKKLKNSLNLAVDTDYLYSFILNIKTDNIFNIIKHKLVSIIKMKENGISIYAYYKVIFFSLNIFQAENSSNLRLWERRNTTKAIALEEIKQKYIKRYEKQRIKMAQHTRYNGLNFIFYHRSKLSFTYILRMSKPFFHKRKVFSLHWLDIYKKIRKVVKFLDINKRLSLDKIFSLHYKIKAKTPKLASFYNTLKFCKRNLSKFHKLYYKNNIKKTSFFKNVNAKKYFNVIKKKLFNNKIYFRIIGDSKHLYYQNKFKKFNNFNLSIFNQSLNRLKGQIKNYSILCITKVIKFYDKKIKEIYE